MVRKIQNGEYLKRIGNMTAAERSEFLGRVGGWLAVSGQCLIKKSETFEARLQNVLQVSVGWNDAECAAFEEGAVLLSALIGVADTKLPELLYAISAKRSIKRMFQLLLEAEKQAVKARPAADATGAAAATGAETSRHNNDSVRMQAGAAKESLLQADMRKPRQKAPQQLFDEQAMGKPAAHGTTPVRPKHIDQYIHLLPKKTQERAGLVQGLFRELDDAREKMRLLMNDQTASAADREAWAKKATRCDNTLRKIFSELDTEWAKLVKEGRVVVDALGNARVVPEGNGESGDAGNGVASPAGRPAKLTSEQKARRRDLRKWLVDTRRGNGDTRDEHVNKWRENFREYMTLEGGAAEDGKILEAAAHYGLDIEELRTKKD